MKTADLLITNASIWNASTQTFSLDTGVAIHNGRILDIGKTQNLVGQYVVKETWNAGGKLLLPGFINTHCHLFQIFMRGLGKDLPFLNWVHQTVRLFMPLLDEDAIYLAGMIGCLEAIRSGTTTLVDFMYANVKPGMTDAILQAFNDCGIRGILAYGINDRKYLPGSTAPAFSFETVENRIAEMEQMRSDYQAHSRIRFMLAPGVIWGMTREGLVELAHYARSQKLAITMHLLETADDDEFSLANYGLRTVPLLEETGILENDFLAVHAIQLQDEDIELFKRYHSKVSYNPVANMILGSGVAPIPELARYGIQMGLGTDGAASNDSQSIIEVMKSGVLLQKVHHHDPAALSAEKVFSMATSEGAAAISMEDQIGSLAPGKRADILVVNLDLPNTTPCYDPITSLVYSGNEKNISAVFIEGRLLLEDGVFTCVDEPALIKKTQEMGRALFKTAFAV